MLSFRTANFLEDFPKCPQLFMRDGDRPALKGNFAVSAIANETCEVLFVNGILDLLSTAEQRHHPGVLDLLHQPPEDCAGRFAPDQSGPDDDGAALLCDNLRLQFRPAIQRAATFISADGGN